ncbi:MAG: hypothetical protein KAV87_37315 [Desulfobacteraceae bacterium]|nr:hypothetical protein [Desulfobacteraceae bacterium]
MGGSGGGANSTVNENPLPDWAAPYVQKFLTRANVISTKSVTAYEGATYAIRNQNEIDGIAALAARAKDGNTTINLGSALLISTLQGNRLSGYPEKDEEWAARSTESYEDFIYEIMPKINTNANAAGGYGGSGHMKAQIFAARKLFNSMATLAYEVFGRDYFTERRFMTDGIGYAEGFAQNSIADTEALRLAGLFEREYQQGILEDYYKLWLDEQDQEIRKLDVMGNAIRAMVGSTVERTTPLYRPGEMAEMAGIALTGISALGSMYNSFNNPAGGTTKLVGTSNPKVATSGVQDSTSTGSGG